MFCPSKGILEETKQKTLRIVAVDRLAANQRRLSIKRRSLSIQRQRLEVNDQQWRLRNGGWPRGAMGSTGLCIRRVVGGAGGRMQGHLENNEKGCCVGQGALKGTQGYVLTRGQWG